MQDGEYSVTIRLYGDSLAQHRIWEDSYRVQTRGGVFNIEIGSGETPLPASADLDRDLWLSLQIGGSDELRPLSHLTASPLALNVADGSISARKISADYVRSLTINGQTLTGNGVDLDIQTGDGLSAAVDPATGTIVLKGNNDNSGGSSNGSTTQGNTTISGSLSVTGGTTIGTNISIAGNLSVGGNLTFGNNPSDSILFNARAGSNLNMAGYDITNVGILSADSVVLGHALSAANGGTGFSGYATGDLLYGNSSSSLSRLGVGSSGQMLTVSGGLPVWTSTTYPSTVSANQLLFASGANAVTGLSSANNGVLVTNGSGTPSMGSTLPNAVQDNITRLGTVTSFGSTVVPIANGGTGATTRAGALAALAPDTTGQTGKVLSVRAGGGIGWASAGSGIGTVSSVTVSGGTTGLSTSGGPITTLGTITLGGAVNESHGGTGQTSYTTGDMLYASSSSTLSKLPVGTSTKVIGSNGSTPNWVENGATITNNVTTPAALIGNTNDYAIGTTITVIRLTNNAGHIIDLTGINATGVSGGRIITLQNIGSDAITIKHQNASSAPANRFDLPGASDVIIAYRGSATFMYDATTEYWVLTSTN